MKQRRNKPHITMIDGVWYCHDNIESRHGYNPIDCYLNFMRDIPKKNYIKILWDKILKSDKK